VWFRFDHLIADRRLQWISRVRSENILGSSRVLAKSILESHPDWALGPASREKGSALPNPWEDDSDLRPANSLITKSLVLGRPPVRRRKRARKEFRNDSCELERYED